MPCVVKVQRPLNAGATDDLLVYAESRRHRSLQPPEPAVLTAMGQDVKAFFHATWDAEAETWVIFERVSDRPW